MLWVGNLCSSLLHFRCLRSSSCPSVSQSWSTPAVMVENRGPTKTPTLIKLCSIKQTSRSDDQINSFELADLTKSIGRGQRKESLRDRFYYLVRTNEWLCSMLRRRLTLPRVSPVGKGRARCLDCISGV